MGPKVSIIIPVYNAEETLVRCVESLIYGQEKNVEIILIDDFSKDNSWEICQKLERDYNNVLCVQNEFNKGVSFTRNHGLDIATGKYVLFVDSDDWVSGKYVKEMLQTAEAHYNQLVLCGYHFLNEIEGTSQVFIYNELEEQDIVFSREYFLLLESVLMQQLWNKIFQLNIIRQNNIRFDESQSMGEDFQFVLDYIQAAQPESCRVLNQALYYYVRANSTSLMSNFGLDDSGQEFRRYERLWELTGNREWTEEQYKKTIANAKEIKLYQVMHSNKLSKQKKVKFIEMIMQDGNAVECYRRQKLILQKEQIYHQFQVLRDIGVRVLNRIRQNKYNYLVRKIKAQLKVKEFTVISQNCIGGVFCHDMGIQFFSPTINLFFSAEDFVQFVLHLEKYLDMELKLSWEETYPIGMLGDVKINFMHYSTCTEAKEKWEKRKKRICWERIIVLATDRNGFNEEEYNRWKKIPYPKILFTSQKKFAEETGSVYFQEYEQNGFVPDLIPKREFYKDGFLLNTVNEFIRGTDDD